MEEGSFLSTFLKSTHIEAPTSGMLLSIEHQDIYKSSEHMLPDVAVTITTTWRSNIFAGGKMVAKDMALAVTEQDNNKERNSILRMVATLDSNGNLSGLIGNRISYCPYKNPSIEFRYIIEKNRSHLATLRYIAIEGGTIQIPDGVPPQETINWIDTFMRYALGEVIEPDGTSRPLTANDIYTQPLITVPNT